MFEANTVIAAGIPVAYMILQLSALMFLEGRWLNAAVASAMTMAGSLLVFLVGIVLAQPTTHMPLTMGLPLATMFLGLLWAVYGIRQMVRTKRQSG